MSNWKVSKERITLFPHPNAEKLELGKVGTYQVVVQKGLYRNGDEVVFVPEKSVLSGALRDAFATYLAGSAKNRVREVALRGELSEGILLGDDHVHNVIGKSVRGLTGSEDLATLLGITKYEPPIPSHLAGDVDHIPDHLHYGNHDCEQFGVYQDQLDAGEDVVITEKLHGSQAIYFLDGESGLRFVASKGLLSRQQALRASDTNAYWQAAPPIWALLERMRTIGMAGPSDSLQVFGELIPCQGGAWTYGEKLKTVRVFDVRVNGRSLPYDLAAPVWAEVWVPILYRGPFDADLARGFRSGMEQVSGRELHIREGVVVRPYLDRRASDGTPLRLKVINPAYKATGEEFN